MDISAWNRGLSRGEKARQEGIPASPVLDNEGMKILRESGCDMEEFLRGWHQGWHQENVRHTLTIQASVIDEILGKKEEI